MHIICISCGKPRSTNDLINYSISHTTGSGYSSQMWQLYIAPRLLRSSIDHTWPWTHKIVTFKLSQKSLISTTEQSTTLIHIRYLKLSHHNICRFIFPAKYRDFGFYVDKAKLPRPSYCISNTGCISLATHVDILHAPFNSICRTPESWPVN